MLRFLLVFKKLSGSDTIIELDKQGRKIEKMERDMETVEDNNKQAEVWVFCFCEARAQLRVRMQRHVRGLKSVFGRIANKFSKNDSIREESKVSEHFAWQTACSSALCRLKLGRQLNRRRSLVLVRLSGLCVVSSWGSLPLLTLD